MAEQKYTGKAADRRYRGTAVDVTYSLRRCIHAEQCIHHLREVFDNEKRPWIQPENSAADEIARTVMLCPSGALHYERKDGGTEEATPAINTITLWRNGPLEVRGDLDIVGATVDVRGETRATLCRCGASQNKPFCDNSHLSSGFEAVEQTVMATSPSAEQGGKLTITPTTNGSLHLEGKLQIYNEAGELIFTGDDVWLCRCGGSGDKPFCDSTHERNGFAAE
ncbi:MAG: CDGSH iron-sulfur domain-containing protein [Anaerolineae bacterium]|nr:CDGSH iron-sulfur domain-containing protein [Anaerolineae bacterium]